MERDRHRQAAILYEAHGPAIYHLALSYLGDSAAAEDVLQEVFVTLMEHIDPIRHPRTWLLTVTRNRCLNRMRDGRFEISVPELPEDCALVPDSGDDRLFVEHMLGQLPQQERQVFALHCLDGFTYREIARGLELPMGTVQSRCRAARQKLKAALAQEKRYDTSCGKEMAK